MKAVNIFIIIVIGFVLAAPVLVYGTSFLSDDGATHAVWYSHFSSQLWAGELYPRWVPAMNSGLGSPTFFYYPPGAYFFTSLLKPFFPGDITGLHQLGVSSAAALALSGVFAYLWLEEQIGRAHV